MYWWKHDNQHKIRSVYVFVKWCSIMKKHPRYKMEELVNDNDVMLLFFCFFLISTLSVEFVVDWTQIWLCSFYSVVGGSLRYVRKRSWDCISLNVVGMQRGFLFFFCCHSTSLLFKALQVSHRLVGGCHCETLIVCLKVLGLKHKRLSVWQDNFRFCI